MILLGGVFFLVNAFVSSIMKLLKFCGILGFLVGKIWLIASLKYWNLHSLFIKAIQFEQVVV